MREELYLWEERSFEDKITFPSERFFKGDREERREKAKAETREMVQSEDPETVIVGDADADGLGAVAAIREAMDEEIPFVPAGPHGSDLYLSDALWVLSDEMDGGDVIIQDVTVDEPWKVKALPDVADVVDSILWFDHHEWTDDVWEEVSQHVTELHVDEGVDDEDNDVYEARCTAMMVRDYYEANGVEFDPKFSEAMDVTGEYDLWRLRDDRCHDLNDLTHAVESHDEYISYLREYGADVLSESDEAREMVEEYREEQEELHDAALDRVQTTVIGDITIATIYGNCPQNDVAETIRQRGYADVSVFLKPHGGISIRGSDRFEECNVVAGRMGGGGHAQAAGAFPDDFFNSIRDYNRHWSTHGEELQSFVLSEFRKHIELSILSEIINRHNDTHEEEFQSFVLNEFEKHLE